MVRFFGRISDYIKERFGRRRGLLDYSLLFIVLFLLAFGLVMLYSASSYEASVDHGKKEKNLKRKLVFTIFGLVLIAWVSSVP